MLVQTSREPFAQIPYPSAVSPRKFDWQRQVAQSELPAATKGFLALLSIEYMDAAGGSCFPSEAQLIEKFGYSRPTLTNHIRRAVDAGYLEVWHFGRGLRNRRYNYQAVLPGVGCPGPDEDRKEFFVSPPEDRKEICASLGTSANDNQCQERAAPERAPVEPQVQAPLPTPMLRTPEPPRPVKVPPPDEVPMDWITVGAAMRPDLDAAIIQTSAEKFLDDRRSKGIALVDWTPAWKNWIRNERGPKPVQSAPQSSGKPPYAIEQPSPYKGWTPGPQRGKEETPEETQAAFAAHMKRLGATFDPATGVWIPKHAATPRPAPTVTPEVVKPPVTPVPAPRADNPFRRDAMIVLQAIKDGVSREEVRELEAELRRRREAAEGGISGDG